MGNRAHIIFHEDSTISPAVYLHWNGGPESVYRFLDEMDRRDIRADGEYDAAQMVALINDYMSSDYHSGLSLGIVNGPKHITLTALQPYDHGDNGVYVVTRGNARGNARRVRRFKTVYHLTTDPHHEPARKFDRVWRELTPDEVEQERAAAYANTKYADITERYAADPRPVGYTAYQSRHEAAAV